MFTWFSEFLEQIENQSFYPNKVFFQEYIDGNMFPRLIYLTVDNGSAHFFAFSLIIEATTEKMLQLKMPLKSIYIINLGFIEQKMYYEHIREVQIQKIY